MREELSDLKQQQDEATNLNELDLEGEAIRVSGSLCFWNARLTDAIRELRFCEAELERVEDELYIATRVELEAAGSKPTEAAVHARVGTNTRYLAAQRNVIEAEAEKGRLYGVVDAIRTKRDMISELVKLRLSELSTSPVVRGQFTDGPQLRATREAVKKQAEGE